VSGWIDGGMTSCIVNIAMAIHEFDYLSNEKLGYSKFLEWSKTGGISFKGEGDIKTTCTPQHGWNLETVDDVQSTTSIN
jgi:hypothetical protein